MSKNAVPEKRKCLHHTVHDQDHILSITINPSNQHQHLDARSLDERQQEMYEDLRQCLRSIPGIEFLYLWMDMSFPDTMVRDIKGKTDISRIPRIHWHGVIKLNDTPEFLYQIYGPMRKLGIINIDTCPDIQGFVTYSRKWVTMFYSKTPDNPYLHYYYHYNMTTMNRKKYKWYKVLNLDKDACVCTCKLHDDTYADSSYEEEDSDVPINDDEEE